VEIFCAVGREKKQHPINFSLAKCKNGENFGNLFASSLAFSASIWLMYNCYIKFVIKYRFNCRCNCLLIYMQINFLFKQWHRQWKIGHFYFLFLMKITHLVFIIYYQLSSIYAHSPKLYFLFWKFTTQREIYITRKLAKLILIEYCYICILLLFSQCLCSLKWQASHL